MTNLPLLKIVVAGDGTVGKTSLIRRYCEGKFEKSRVATIGVDFQTHTVPLSGGTVRLSIWDMAGQDQFEVVRKGFYRGSRAAALVFDVTNLESYEHLAKWRDEVLDSTPEQPFVIVGNKIDLEEDRQQLQPPPLGFADSLNAPYVETGAFSGKGVRSMFEALATLAAGMEPAA